MYIYFKKSEEFKALCIQKENESYLLGSHVMGKDLAPHISTSDDYELVMNGLDEVKGHFAKATVYLFPNYKVERLTGEYVFRHAHATLKMTDKNEYMLVIWIDTWKGMKDIQKLIDKLYAGTIAPTVSYEEDQWLRIRSFFGKIFVLTPSESNRILTS